MRGPVLTIVILMTVLAGGSPARAVDVIVEQDRYVGTHAVIVPASVDQRTRQQLSTCQGCAWRFTAPCVLEPDDDREACSSVVRGCPAGRELLRVWFTQQPEPWSERGLVCIDGEEIIPVASLGSHARDRFERRVPGPAPACEPPAGAITQIPIVCTSGQRVERPRWDEALLGIDVRIEAAPTWTWEFDPGVVLHTASPGGTYPDMSITHTYRTAGTRTIRVTTEWRGSYTADGLGPFPLAPIRLHAELPITIGQARAVLTRP